MSEPELGYMQEWL